MRERYRLIKVEALDTVHPGFHSEEEPHRSKNMKQKMEFFFRLIPSRTV